MKVNIYTDGSCDAQVKRGGWASIILFADEKVVLHGIEDDVTHQQMELQAVLNSIRYVEEKALTHHDIVIYSDSQYVVDLAVRKDKLENADFKTKVGVLIRNASYVQQLLRYMDRYRLHFVKLKAHARGDLHHGVNREVDMLVRKELRKALRND